MKEKILTRRYACAFMSLAADTIGVEQAINEFRVLKWIVVENPEFLHALEDPSLTHDAKMQCVNRVMCEKFSHEICDFLHILIDKNRIGLLLGIADYIRINYAREGAVETVLKMAYPLELDLVAAIKKALEERIGKKVKLYMAFDPGLIGGVQIVMGNIIIDGSVKKKLAELKDKLLSLSIV